jgi:predicted Zn-dependent peptidase
LGFLGRDISGGIRLWVYPTEKFKINSFRVFVHTALRPGAARRALIPAVLRRGTASRPQTADLAAALEHLYGADLKADVSKFGERQLWIFSLDLPNERYIEGGEDLLGPALRLLQEVVWRPAPAAEGLRPDYVEQERDNLIHQIQAVINDKAHYAMQRCVEEMFAPGPFALPRYGRVEDLTGVTARDLYEEYRAILDESRIDLYAVGALDPEVLTSRVEECFGVDRTPGPDLPLAPPLPPPTSERLVTERLPVNQGKLVMGLYTGTPFTDPSWPALSVANGILGGFTHSKLFQNVRERASLAYYANSRLEATKSAGFITAGIEFTDLDRAIGIIRQQIQDLQAGAISDAEFNNTQSALRHAIRVSEDSPGARILTHLERSMYGKSDDPEVRMAELARVTPEDCVAAARRIQVDTVYFLDRPDGAGRGGTPVAAVEGGLDRG